MMVRKSGIPAELLFLLLSCYCYYEVYAWVAPQRIANQRQASLLSGHKESSDVPASSRRRNFGTQLIFGTAAGLLLGERAYPFLPVDPAYAVVTDETDTFATNWWETPKAPTPRQAATEAAAAKQSSSSNSNSNNDSNPASSSTDPTDQVTVSVKTADLLQSKSGLGLELSEVEFRTNLRVFVKAVAPQSLAEGLGIQQNWIVVGVNGKSTERTNAAGVAQMLQQEILRDKNGAIALTFRDPSAFRQQLSNMSSSSTSSSSSSATTNTATTQIAPAGDTTQRYADGSLRPGTATETSQSNQQLSVSQLIPPKGLCRNGGAQTDDLLEISYRGSVVETGQIFDGSAVAIDGKGIAGRGDDVTLYFVLGKQPYGQFPPGWDVGLVGQCIGERRRILVPPVLAYGAKGLPRRNIPPNATLQYDITVVSINGLATP